MPKASLYIPTKTMYQQPDFSKHVAGVRDFLIMEFGEHYAEQTVSEKWDLLMNKFKTVHSR